MLTREMLEQFMETATCEEVKMAVREQYIRCGQKAVAIVKHEGRDEGPYAMCLSCAWHNVKNRRGFLVLGKVD